MVFKSNDEVFASRSQLDEDGIDEIREGERKADDSPAPEIRQQICKEHVVLHFCYYYSNVLLLRDLGKQDDYVSAKLIS